MPFSFPRSPAAGDGDPAPPAFGGQAGPGSVPPLRYNQTVSPCFGSKRHPSKIGSMGDIALVRHT